MRGLVPAALLGFAIQPLTGYLTMILNGIMSYEIQQTVFLPQSLAEWLVALLCLCMIPALCEEAFFRGMLQQTLTERFGCRSALVTVSVMFAAAHLSLSALPALLIISLMLCLCRQWTDSLPACAVMHATFNAAALMQLDTSTCPLFLLCCVAVVLLGTINLWRKSL